MTGKTFLLLALLLVILDVAIPYLFLRDIASFGGSFLFWTVLPAIGILAAAFYTRPWSNK
jgi:NADH:ubiquinone oxidoreductase subunit 3 (subunit A)